MIKFFRKIRQRLLTENKFIKYLIYAIGEIVLVVIGILIALQLNNLNDERKLSEVRKVYYDQILKDFEQDRTYIEEKSLQFDSNMVALNAYREIFKQPDLPPTALLGSIGELSWLMRDVKFQSNAIATLQSTGDIKILPVHIRDKLIRLKSYQDETARISKGNNKLALEMSTYATRYFGSHGLIQSLANQPQLAEYIFEKNRAIELLLALEASQMMKEKSESSSLERFDKILADLEELTTLIKGEL